MEKSTGHGPKMVGQQEFHPAKIFLLHVGHKAPASQRETFQRYKVVQDPWQKIASAVPMRKFTTARAAFVFAPCFYLAWTDALEISTHVAPQNMHFCKVITLRTESYNEPSYLALVSGSKHLSQQDAHMHRAGLTQLAAGNGFADL